MGLVIDSGQFIAAQRQGKAPEPLVQSIKDRFGDTPLAVSVVTIAELAHGVWRGDESQRARSQDFLDRVMLLVRVHPFTADIALRVGHVGAGLALTGQRLDFPDLIIGTTALSLSHAVLTNNPPHFARIPCLPVHTL